jgi:hypothetical protein
MVFRIWQTPYYISDIKGLFECIYYSKGGGVANPGKLHISLYQSIYDLTCFPDVDLMRSCKSRRKTYKLEHLIVTPQTGSGILNG